MLTTNQARNRVKKTLAWPAISTAFLLTLANCGGGSQNNPAATQQPSTEATSETQIIEKTEKALANIQVVVKNTSGNLIPQASIQLYDVTNQTIATSGLSDESGTYNAQNIDSHTHYSIKAEHKDYVLQVTDIEASFSTSTLNTVTITMAPIGEKVVFNEDTGGVVPLTTKSRGVKLTVPANAFIDEKGAAIEGLIDAEVTTIDMSSTQESVFFRALLMLSMQMAPINTYIAMESLMSTFIKTAKS